MNCDYMNAPLNINSDEVLGLEVNKLKGIYTITIKWHHISVKHTFRIDEDTFKYLNIDLRKLLEKECIEVEFGDKVID